MNEKLKRVSELHPIGSKFIVNDNSGCINLKTGEQARLVHNDYSDPDDEFYLGPDKCEGNDAEYEVISNPYFE